MDPEPSATRFLSSSTHLLLLLYAAVRWLHALSSQQPYELLAKERAPMTNSASAGRLYARIIYTNYILRSIY